MNLYCIVVAGGKGLRMGMPIPKQYLKVANKPIIMHTLDRLNTYLPEAKYVLVLPKGDLQFWSELCIEYRFNLSHKAVEGGKERYHSVLNGLKSIEHLDENTVVAIHDAVRPFPSESTLINTFNSAKLLGSGVPAVPVNESLRMLSTETGKSQHIDRSLYKLVQTPQCFNLKKLLSAYSLPYQDSFTDDASVFEAAGNEIILTEGNPENIKITRPVDLSFAEHLLSKKA
jgi:2-C-methyl-D-erythritol 4-phosphate cytidylyltransferase